MVARHNARIGRKDAMPEDIAGASSSGRKRCDSCVAIRLPARLNAPVRSKDPGYRPMP